MSKNILVSVLVAFCLLASLASSALAASGEVLVLHFDEGSGTVLRDSSGNGHDGTIYGATWVGGISGTALSFNRIDDDAKVSDHPNFNFGPRESFTLECWLKTTATPSVEVQIVGKYPDTAVTPVYMLMISERGTLRSLIRDSDQNTGTAGKYLESENIINNGYWHQLAVVREAGIEQRLYINGDLVASQKDNTEDLKNPFDLSFATTFNTYAPMTIDEVRIYNRALSTDEIKAQYLALAPPTPTPVPTPTPAPTPSKPDSDGDGWSDEKEEAMGTNPYSLDSDKDGLNDPQDPNPTVPEKENGMPGFEAVLAIAGLLAVAYLGRRKQ